MNLTIWHLTHSIVTLLIISAFINPLVHAASQGVIAFYGTLSESDCDKHQAGKLVTYTCRRGGELLSSHWAVSNQNSTLPFGIATTSVYWLDGQQQKGIITVNYN